MQSIIFIHRSVGHNLIHDGNLHKLISDTGKFIFSDYDQNSDILTDSNSKQQNMGFVFPGSNTRPQDFSVIFSDNVPKEYKSIQDEALRHDVVIVKSCYPNSNIQSNEELEMIKRHYQSVCDFFAKSNKKLVVLTSPPLTPVMTKSDRANRARQLADWLMSSKFGDNIKVFDFFSLLATPKDRKHSNTLKKEYRRWLPFDSHPNVQASKEIAPKLVAFLQKTNE